MCSLGLGTPCNDARDASSRTRIAICSKVLHKTTGAVEVLGCQANAVNSGRNAIRDIAARLHCVDFGALTDLSPGLLPTDEVLSKDAFSNAALKD